MADRESRFDSPERTVHGHSMFPSDPWDIVRYDRAGKWFIEHQDGRKRRISVRDAAFWTARNHFNPGLPGGRTFDALVREYRAEYARNA